MFSIILYFIFIYWILTVLFLKKSRHYFFQRFLFLFIIQSLCLISLIESYSLVLIGAFYLKFTWLFIFVVYICIYIWQLVVSLTKMFPNISTTEWWEAFHVYNWCNLWRSISEKNLIFITNTEWLKNQQNNHLNNAVYRILVVKKILKLLSYAFFIYLLYHSKSLDLEYFWFKLDFFIFTYFLFLPLIFFVFLFITSIFFKKIKWKYLVLFISFFVEARIVDRAEFDPSFGFMLSLEDLVEYQLYSSHLMYCRSPTSHKKPRHGIHDLDLNNTTNFSRLVWNDMWWDCNMYYFSHLYDVNLIKKYNNKQQTNKKN